MPLPTGNEILNYQGNANLGNTGQNGIDPDTSKLQDTVFNMAYLNLQKNKDVWNQKLKDRDSAMQLIANGELNLGKVPPEYRDQLRAQIDDVKKMWFEKGGDLKGNPNDWMEFNDKLGELMDNKNQAQSKLLEWTKEANQAAQEKNPIKKQAILDNMQKNMDAPLKQSYMPYQQTLDYDPKKIFHDLPTLILKDDPEGDYDVKTIATDLEKSRKTYYDDYNYDQNGDTAHHFDTFLQDWVGNSGMRSPEVVKDNLDLVNRKLNEINAERGLTQGNKDFLTPLTMAQLPNGQWQTGDTTPDAVFKIALATNYKKSTDKSLNLDYAKKRKMDEEVNTEKAKQDHLRMQGHLAAAHARFWDSHATAQQNVNHVANIFDDVVARAKITPFETKTTDGKGNVTNSQKFEKHVVWTGDLPEGFTTMLSGVDEKGVPIPLEPKKTSGGGKYYEVHKTDFYYNPESGARYSSAEIDKAFRMQNAFKDKKKFMDHLIQKQKLRQDIELIGANGRASAQSTLIGLRALNNKLMSNKGDESLTRLGDNDSPEGGDTETTGTSSSSSSGGSGGVTKSSKE